MWAATVILNQHYIIDLLAGALLAVAAWWVEKALKAIRQTTFASRSVEACEKRSNENGATSKSLAVP